MGFQSAVSLAQGFGVPGQIYNNSPKRVRSYIINSASAAYNIIGATAFSITSQGNAAAGNTTGSLVFAGILVNAGEQFSNGGSGGPLTPTLTLPNYAQGELATMGSFVVTLPATANIGDIVIFDNTTGALATIVPGASLPSGKSYANAYVDFYTVSAAGLAVITINSITPAVVQ